MSDWSADPQAKRYLDHVRLNVLPRIEESALFLALMPDGEPDLKMATELGLAILLGKPLIVVATRGEVIPDSLERLASAVVRGAIDDPDTLFELKNAILRFGADT